MSTNIFTQSAIVWTYAVWVNTRTHNTRSGRWYYYWPSDRFVVEIKGLPRKSIDGERPEYGNWKCIKDNPPL